MDDLRKFYEVGELNAGDEKPAPLRAVAEAKKQPKLSERKKQLEQQLTQVTENYQKLNDLTERAKIKEGEEESPGRLAALSELVQQFYTLANKVRVKLKEPLLGSDGRELRKFAMKELDEEKGDRQLATLEDHVKIAKRYFPLIELKEIASADDPPKRVAIVFGIDAEEFNAVIIAEKQRKLFENEIKSLQEAYASTITEEALRKAAQPRTNADKVKDAIKESESAVSP